MKVQQDHPLEAWTIAKEIFLFAKVKIKSMILWDLIVHVWDREDIATVVNIVKTDHLLQLTTNRQGMIG